MSLRLLNWELHGGAINCRVVFCLVCFSKGEIVILVKILLKFKGMKNQNQVDKYNYKSRNRIEQKIEKK